MGVGGKFWDLLKPYARLQGFDFLRDKRVAVDLSFWIIQHETAVKGFVRKPHLRLTFFRTINLFSKFGAYPVFVVDGTPSPLKSRARIARFFRSSGIDVSNLPAIERGLSVERNSVFTECVRECVELLELLGVPVIKAEGEAEALCAQLNSSGHVDACITPDADAFLFGAKCVIKSINPNSTEPFECFYMSDIEASLGLKQNHLIAISLLVGNDYDSSGVQGIGVDTALRFVQAFNENEILERLDEIGKGLKPAAFLNETKHGEEKSQRKRASHCAYCGHPGSKRTHSKFPCVDCNHTGGCRKKPLGFICGCSLCCKDRSVKELKKSENWWAKICDKITQQQNFPDKRIIELYLCGSSTDITADCSLLSWRTPNTEMLVDFMVFKLMWEPSYVRKMLLPMLSTLYLREKAGRLESDKLMYDQYEFDSIQRMKTRYGRRSFVMRWRKSVSMSSSVVSDGQGEESRVRQGRVIDVDDDDDNDDDPLDEVKEPEVHDDGSSCFLLTDESIDLVLSAFPEEAKRFLHHKGQEESKSPRSKGSQQQSITDFFRSTKAQTHTDPGEGFSGSVALEGKRRAHSSSNLSKSVRRRLLFG